MKCLIALPLAVVLGSCSQVGAKHCFIPVTREVEWDGNLNGPGAVIRFQSKMRLDLESCLATSAYRLDLTGEAVATVAEAAMAECQLDLDGYVHAVRSRSFGMDYQTTDAQDRAVRAQAEQEARRMATQAALDGRLAGCDKGAPSSVSQI